MLVLLLWVWLHHLGQGPGREVAGRYKSLG